jgi:hypothetical protein
LGGGFVVGVGALFSSGSPSKLQKLTSVRDTTFSKSFRQNSFRHFLFFQTFFSKHDWLARVSREKRTDARLRELLPGAKEEVKSRARLKTPFTRPTHSEEFA